VPTLTNILRTILQGDARSYVQATQQAGSATDRFARSVLSANAALKRTERVRADLGAGAFESGLEAFKQTEAALQRQKTLRADLARTQGNLTRVEVVATGAAVAFDAALGKVVRTGMERQSTRLTFQNQFGRGSPMFGQIGDLARRGPFSADALRESALSLREMGEDARQIVPDLQALGNAAAFTGRGDEGIRRLSAGLAQSRQEHVAAPLIGAMEAEGLRPYDILRAKLGLIRPQAQALANDYASADRLQRALLQGMREAGGGHAMEDRLGTAAAQAEKFRDALKDLEDEIGTGYLPQVTDLTHRTTDLIRGLSPEAKQAAGTGLAVGGGIANLAATIGIPAATAWNTWKIAQMAKVGGTAAEAGPSLLGRIGTGAGRLWSGVSRFAEPLLAVTAAAALGHGLLEGERRRTGAPAGIDPREWVVAQQLRKEGKGYAISNPKIRQAMGLDTASVSVSKAAAGAPPMTPAEQAHLAELQRQTDLLEQQNALLGRATVPGGQGVVPFDQVPLRRQLLKESLNRKGG
jgi:hypothetical protein